MTLKCLALTLTLLFSNTAFAALFGGIEFPGGSSSFVDSVIKYTPSYSAGTEPTDPNFMDPVSALGAPDYSGSIGSVSLGSGGLIELSFIDNVLTNSGNSALDIHIFEIGPDVEDTFLALRPTSETLGLLGGFSDSNGDGFYEIGKVFGSTDSIDIDTIFTGFAAGILAFDAVQLIDDPSEGATSGSTVGADIDAVGAISTRRVTVPEPSIVILMCIGLTGFSYRLCNRKRV